MEKELWQCPRLFFISSMFHDKQYVSRETEDMRKAVKCVPPWRRGIQGDRRLRRYEMLCWKETMGIYNARGEIYPYGPFYPRLCRPFSKGQLLKEG